MPTIIPVNRISRLCNPFIGQPWAGRAVTKASVSKALKAGRLIAEPNEKDHAGRIAYLVVNEAKDPISIDVGIPRLGLNIDWIIDDGNHRLAAAIYAKRETIPAVVGGDMEYAFELFDVDCSQ